ncbi:Hpt domain-containing protein [Hahella sp. KA22]|uniref:Hpt domain-containing protein n=1 Tax=Hahella sp. KA22 TaxID=1628392 RepID=UPI000FDD97D3|nr:Hpt domain-containing protein [Hahella sp. KA22]AZZ92895.1 Hpt domain-containing protein [Hahella sp. KA22]QAY56269.1 Hpt domain-containing protein [Hahella sp. KA22]
MKDEIKPKQSTLDYSKLLLAGQQEGALGNHVRELVCQVLGRGKQPVVNIRKAIADESMTEALRLAHTLRGSMGTLGAEKVADSAGELEESIRADSNTDKSRLLNALERRMDAMLKELTAWSQQFPPSSGCLANVELDLEMLQRWRELLESRNMEALDYFDRIRSSLQTLCAAAQFESIREKVANLQFDEVLEELDELMQENGHA